MQEPDPEIEAPKPAAATEARNRRTTPPDDETKKENKEKLKSYDASQAKIRAEDCQNEEGIQQRE